MEQSNKKIQLIDKIEIQSDDVDYTKIMNGDYFPKQNILTFFVRHCYDKRYQMQCTDPTINNGVLQIYSASNFSLLKSIPFEHFNKYLIQDEDTLIIYQTFAFTKSETSPYIKFFDLNKLEVVDEVYIPRRSKRLTYQQLIHEPNCKCDLVREVNKLITGHIKSDCKWKTFDHICKDQFYTVIKANQHELIYTFKFPIEKVNENNFQVWNHKTQEIRDVTYSHPLGEIQKGAISKPICLSRLPKHFPQPFVCKFTYKTLLLLRVQAQYVGNSKSSVKGYKNHSFVVAEIVENEEQIKTHRVFETSDELFNYKELENRYYLNEDQTRLLVVVSPYSVDVFDFQTAKLIRTIKYRINDRIQKITFFENTFSVLSVEICNNKLRNKPKDISQDCFITTSQYTNIYVNDLESGKRLARHSQVIDGFGIDDGKKHEYPKNRLFNIKYYTNKDSLMFITAFHMIKKNYNFNVDDYNEIYFFQSPLIKDMKTPELQDFENIQDNQIDWWHNKHICACGQYLQKNPNFAKQYQKEESYNFNPEPEWSSNNPKRAQCHLCNNSTIYWACSNCQYTICKACRPEDIRDIKPLVKTSKENNPYNPKKIQKDDEQVQCTTCTITIKSEFYFDSNDSKQCLMCNEPEEWFECRKYHRFEQLNEYSKNPCLKCGEVYLPNPRYNCTQCGQVFCTACMIQDIPQQIFHPQTLRAKCLNNHWLLVHKTTESNATCLLCPMGNNEIKDNLHLRCEDCNFSLCKNHAPFHQDNIISHNNRKLVLYPNLKESKKCSGCKEYMTEDIYITLSEDCKTKYCENCVNPRPRKVYEKEFLAKYNIQPICPKCPDNPQMCLKGIGCKDKCKSCEQQYDKEKFKFAIACEKCNYHICNECVLLTYDNVRSDGQKYLRYIEMNRSWRCIGCNQTDCPTNYCQATLDSFPTCYCTNCLPLDVPKLKRKKVDLYITELKKLQEQFGDQLEYSEDEQDKPRKGPCENPEENKNKQKKGKQSKHELEKCPKGHPLAIEIVNQDHINRTLCQICKTLGLGDYQMCTSKKSIKEYILYKCKECNTHTCVNCIHGFWAEILPCTNGHQMKLTPHPIKEFCYLCGQFGKSIRYICPKEQCNFQKFCTGCIPFNSIENKPETKTPEQAKKDIKEGTHYKDFTQLMGKKGKKIKKYVNTLKYIDIEQNDSHELEKCPKGHDMALNLCSETNIDDGECSICRKVGLRQYPIYDKDRKGNNDKLKGFLYYRCNKCYAKKCVDCSHGFYSEIIPCFKGHKTEFLPVPERGCCLLCNYSSENIRYKCKEEHCYRDHFCELCLPFKSIEEKPKPITPPPVEKKQQQPQQQEVKQSPQIQEQVKQAPQQQQQVKQETQQNEKHHTPEKQPPQPTYTELEQKDTHPMEVCPEGHTMSIDIVGEYSIDDKKCFNCNKQGLREKEIKEDGKENGRSKGFLVYKCQSCRINKCISCTSGFYSEIVPCRKGHKTQFISKPEQGSCQLCTGVAKNIQYKCADSGCYRDTYCNLCLPVKSIENKPKQETIIPEVKKQEEQRQEEQRQEEQRQEQQRQEEQRQDQQRQEQQRQEQQKQEEQKQEEQIAIKEEPQEPQLQQSDSHLMETCPEGHIMAVDLTDQWSIDDVECFNCKKKGLREKEVKQFGEENGRTIGFLNYRCKQCRIYKCLTCTSGFHSEIVPCRLGHKTELLPYPQQGRCQICSGVAKNIQYKCPDPGCYTDNYCTKCFPIKSIANKPVQSPIVTEVKQEQEEQKQEEEVKTEEIPEEPQFLQKDSHEMETCSKGHTMAIAAVNESYIDDKQCLSCKKYGHRQREIKEDGKYHIGFLMYKCTQCNEFKCIDCTQGLYSEIIPCKKGHKTEFLQHPEQGDCAICKGRAPNLQYKCPECYRDKFCTLCFPLNSIVNKPPPLEQPTQKPVSQNEPFIQKDDHQMETCPEGHIMATDLLSAYGIEDEQCNCCKKSNLNDHEIRDDQLRTNQTKGYLVHKCKKCRYKKCHTCTKGFYSEIVPCVKGHKTELLEHPEKSSCNLCGSNQMEIRYKCKESQCYREKYCTKCFPLRSIYDKE